MVGIYEIFSFVGLLDSRIAVMLAALLALSMKSFPKMRLKFFSKYLRIKIALTYLSRAHSVVLLVTL